MAGDPPPQEEPEDDLPTNIQLGIFIPPPTTTTTTTTTHQKRQQKKLKTTNSVQLEANGDQVDHEAATEFSGRSRGKRKRLDSRDSEEDVTPDTPTAKRHEKQPELEKDEKDLTKTKRKKRQKKKRKLPAREGSSGSTGVTTDKDRALEYLSSWDSGSNGWTFRKKTQYWLLQNTYDKNKVSLCKQKTVQQ